MLILNYLLIYFVIDAHFLWMHETYRLKTHFDYDLIINGTSIKNIVSSRDQVLEIFTKIIGKINLKHRNANWDVWRTNLRGNDEIDTLVIWPSCGFMLWKRTFVIAESSYHAHQL